MYARIIGFIMMATLLIACDSAVTSSPQPASLTGPETPQQLQEPLKVTIWTYGSTAQEADAFKQILANFRANHPDIQIPLTELPSDTYTEQVHAAAYEASIAGGLPCLLEFDGPNTYNYVWKGLLIPLDDYISAEMSADFLPSIIAQGTYQDGKLYSLGQFDSGLAPSGVA